MSFVAILFLKLLMVKVIGWRGSDAYVPMALGTVKAFTASVVTAMLALVFSKCSLLFSSSAEQILSEATMCLSEAILCLVSCRLSPNVFIVSFSDSKIPFW